MSHRGRPLKPEVKTNSRWIPLVEYANTHGVSLSTLRRHIKSGKIQFKVQDGRYLILDTSAPSAVTHLQADLMKAREEIAELKTLIALYEENMAPHRNGS